MSEQMSYKEYTGMALGRVTAECLGFSRHTSLYKLVRNHHYHNLDTDS
jgi:hypothetical protein